MFDIGFSLKTRRRLLEMRLVNLTELEDVSTRALTSVGVPKNDARTVAQHLVEADLRSRSSHGVLRLPGIVAGIKKGAISRFARVTIIRETRATALLDGNHGLGQVVSMKAVKMAIGKAQSVGVGVVSVRNSSHVGFMGYYTLHSARQNMIGIALTNTEPAMAPTGGIEKILGSNPISIGIPSRVEPIVVDLSTTVVSRGRIVELEKAGMRIPLAWALDREGKETEDPGLALEGSILPIAGAKGYALSLAFDLLTGALSGSSVGKSVRGTLHTTDPPTKGDLFISINPDFFGGIDGFLDKVELLKNQIRRTKRAKGIEKIFVPGERGNIQRAQRIREGIPVDAGLWEELNNLARHAG